MACKIINFFGSPGAGKSTTAAGLFVLMKRLHHKCELVTEFAKDVVYRGDHATLDRSQALIFGEQKHRQERAASVVDYVITDSPILLSAIYGAKQSSATVQGYIDDFKSFDNINFLIRLNVDNYKTYGRMQTPQESLEIEQKILKLLDDYGIEFREIRNEFDAYAIIKATQ